MVKKIPKYDLRILAVVVFIALSLTLFAKFTRGQDFDDYPIPVEDPPFYFEGDGVSDYYYVQMSAFISFIPVRIDVVVPSALWEPQMGSIQAYIFSLNSGAGEYEFGYENEFERMYMYGNGDILRTLCRATLTEIMSLESEFDYLEGAWVLNVPASKAVECEEGDRTYVPILRDWR